jgi:hypothetical protein
MTLIYLTSVVLGCIGLALFVYGLYGVSRA